MAKIIIKSSIHKNICHFGTPFKVLNNYAMIIHPNHSFVKGYTQKSQFVNNYSAAYVVMFFNTFL
jgi:hypothetical protein